MRKQSGDYDTIIEELKILIEIQNREKELLSIKSAIVSKYGKQAIKIEKNTITVTIPFNKINVNKFNVVYDKVDFKLNKSQDTIIKLIRDNPNITADQMAIQIGISVPAIKKNLKQLTDKNIIKRVGAKKNGYWEIIQQEIS